MLFTIDKHLEFVDFGRMVITQMLDFVVGIVAESKLLPYPTLIAKLLEQQGVISKAGEEIVKIKRHQLG